MTAGSGPPVSSSEADMWRPEEIVEWFSLGVMNGDTHLLLIYDTFDKTEYPIYAKGDDAAADQFRLYNGASHQQVKEVFDLRLGTDEQMLEERAWHLPRIVQRRAGDAAA
jgi:hypothetical protein